MSEYGWVIDKVYENVGLTQGEVGTRGPGNISEKLTEALWYGEGARFKMGDDDGHTYYEGRIVGEEAGIEDTDAGFKPLDDFGMPNAGCVWIKYKNKETGKWEVL